MEDERTSERGQWAGGASGMFLSAAIFGFFGFFFFKFGPSPTTYASLFLWTLKVAAVAFAVCGVASFAQPVGANLAYGVIGLAAAASFLVVAAMDLLDPGPPLFAYSPVILIFFAIWNGWNAWTSLRAFLAIGGRSSR